MPLSNKNAFWAEYERRSYPIGLALQAHFAKYFGQTSTIDIRTKRSQLIDELFDQLWLLATHIQTQSQRAGWSKNSKLPWAEQLWLDPHRAKTDEVFAAERLDGKWQESIARSFALRLNQTIDKANTHKYRNKNYVATLKTGEDEFNEWYKIAHEKLRLFKEDLEALA